MPFMHACLQLMALPYVCELLFLARRQPACVLPLSYSFTSPALAFWQAWVCLIMLHITLIHFSAIHPGDVYSPLDHGH